MRFWHAAAFLLIACGGKIATESTGSNGPGPGLHPGAGDDDDDPGYASSSSGVSSSGYYGTASGNVPPAKPYPYPSSSSTSSGFGGTSSSSGTLCGKVNMFCAGDETTFKCAIEGPPGTPSLQCYGDTGAPVAKCNCYGTYLDSGTGDFVLKVPKQPSSKDLVGAWQKYCGGSCN